MTEVAKALQAFYSSFSIPAYAEDSVPDDDVLDENGQAQKVELPYITYTVPQNEAFGSVTHQARVWYATDKGAPSNVEVNAKADEIIAAIGQGVRLRAGRGFICIYPGNPLAQMQPADDATRIVYLNLSLKGYV